MPPPALSVDSRLPSDSNPQNNTSSINPNNNNNTDCFSFNTGFSNTTSFPSVGRVPSSGRSKPRLVKLRKSSKEPWSVDSGINPFRSFENSGFVFGVSGSNNYNGSINKVSDDSSKAAEGIRDSGNVDSVKKDGNFYKPEFRFSDNEVKRGINRTEGMEFSFGATKCGENGVEVELLDELRKLRIQKESCSADGFASESNNADVSKSGDGVFVFKTGGVGFDVCGESSVPLKSDVDGMNLNGNGKGVDDGKMGAVGSQNVDGNAFVFGRSGNFTNKLGDSSFQSSAFPVENGGAKVNADVLSSSFSFSVLDSAGNAKPEACSSTADRKVESSSSGLPEGSGASISEFQLPDFGSPLSFSATFASGLGRKLESLSRTRGLKDRNLKKTKGKKHLKPTNLQPIQNPLPNEGVTQDQEAPDCYSPMDFSPYDDTASTNDVPFSSHQGTHQTKVTTGTSFAVHTESELNNYGTGISSKMNGHRGDEAQFSFSSDKACRDEENFSFTSSTSAQNHVSPLRRFQRKKYCMKPASVSGSASRDASWVQGSSLDNTPLYSKQQGAGGIFFASASKDNRETEAGGEFEYEAFSAAEKACEKWRKRGNEAYERGELSRAEDFYTWGVNCIPPGSASDVTFKPLVRCYSNRAATRMALGRVREAIQDCLMAVKLDPTFHRAQIRAANCYLQLGEVEEAMQCFGKYMGDGNVVCLDRKAIISAADGIQKSQKVIELASHSSELLKLKTFEAASDALQYIAEALAISGNSEKLIEMKARALCILSRHDEAIKLCQNTLDFAEKNFTTSTPGNHDVGGYLNAGLWRHRALSKCHFHLGNLEVALDHLEKQEGKTQEASNPLAITVRELLKQKSAGNTAFHSGKHAEAVEHYTSAILNSMEARPFAAICFCNRAAAHQALGQLTDAISDCSLAIALDENYAKAISRRATLHETIRDYKQAAADLHRLLSLLQKPSLDKSKQSGSGSGKELRQIQQRLSLMEEEAKKDTPLDLYLILGVKKSDTVSEVKKVYRKAALRHHLAASKESLDSNLFQQLASSSSDGLNLVHSMPFAPSADVPKAIASSPDMNKVATHIFGMVSNTPEKQSAAVTESLSEVEGANGGKSNTDANVAEEDEMEELAPETNLTSEISLGSLTGFGIGSASSDTAPKSNPFGGPITSAPQTIPSSISLTVPSGELFRPASFSFQPLQASQPSQSSAPSGAFGFSNPVQQISSGSGFGQPSQIGSGQQALGSVVGSFGQSRQLGADLPGSGFGVPQSPGGGFQTTTIGGGFAGISSAATGFGGGFATAATSGGGFGAVTSGGGGFAAAAPSGGGFAAAAPSGGGFAVAAPSGGVFAAAGGAGGFGAFGNTGSSAFSAFGGLPGSGFGVPQSPGGGFQTTTIGGGFAGISSAATGFGGGFATAATSGGGFGAVASGGGGFAAAAPSGGSFAAFAAAAPSGGGFAVAAPSGGGFAAAGGAGGFGAFGNTGSSGFSAFGGSAGGRPAPPELFTQMRKCHVRLGKCSQLYMIERGSRPRVIQLRNL